MVFHEGRPFLGGCSWIQLVRLGHSAQGTGSKFTRFNGPLEMRMLKMGSLRNGYFLNPEWKSPGFPYIQVPITRTIVF